MPPQYFQNKISMIYHYAYMIKSHFKASFFYVDSFASDWWCLIARSIRFSLHIHTYLPSGYYMLITCKIIHYHHFCYVLFSTTLLWIITTSSYYLFGQMPPPKALKSAFDIPQDWNLQYMLSPISCHYSIYTLASHNNKSIPGLSSINKAAFK